MLIPVWTLGGHNLLLVSTWTLVAQCYNQPSRQFLIHTTLQPSNPYLYNPAAKDVGVTLHKSTEVKKIYIN